MALALYHPELGYYAKGIQQTGRLGDFFTSVSVGPLFGNILARRFLCYWREAGCPTRWRIIECGAHDGRLANDVLSEIAALDAQAFGCLEYVIPEPLPALQTAQRSNLAAFSPCVRFLTDLLELAVDPLLGIAFGNELIDALPFHVVERCAGRWIECVVALSTEQRLVWQTREIEDSLLLDHLARLGESFPEGYRTEVRTGIREFLTPIVRALDRGLMIWIDYGFARPEYYHPDRMTGTLRTFSKHQAGENPLENFGLCDITAHVDFTALAETSIALGGRPLMFQNQGAWLTENGRDWLLDQEGIPNNPLLRQFQTLTHPSQLGGKFHVLEITWDSDQPADASPSLDHRLFNR